MIELINACAEFEHNGPGSLDDWEPGEDVDFDALAGAVIQAALDLVAEFQSTVVFTVQPKGDPDVES